MRIALLTLVSLLVLPASCGPLASVPEPTGEWTPYSALPLSADSMLRWVGLHVVGDSLLLAGNLLPVDGRSPIPRPPLRVNTLGAGGRVFAKLRPQGTSEFAYPQAVLGPNGRIHLVGADLAGTPDTPIEWASSSADQISHSEWDGKEWSPPSPLAQGRMFSWRPGSRAIRSTDSEVIVALTYVPLDASLPILELLTIDTALTRVRVESVLPRYPVLVPWKRDSSAVLFVSGTRETLSVMSSVGGPSGEWLPPRVIASIPAGEANHLSGTIARDGRVYFSFVSPSNEGLHVLYLWRWEGRAASLIGKRRLDGTVLRVHSTPAGCRDAEWIAEVLDAGAMRVVVGPYDAEGSASSFGSSSSAVSDVALAFGEFDEYMSYIAVDQSGDRKVLHVLTRRACDSHRR